MSSIEVAGNQLVLSEENPYAELIERNQRSAELTRTLGEFAISAEQSPHVVWWKEPGGPFGWERSHLEGKAAAREQRDRYLSEMRGKVVLDLGCGNAATRQQFQELLQGYGPAGYIGVDQHILHGDKQDHYDVPGFGTVLPEGSNRGTILRTTLVEGDLLAVTSKMPKDRVPVITMNGIDNSLIPVDSEYGQAMIKEVSRIVRPGGLVFGMTNNAGILTELAASKHFDAHFIPRTKGEQYNGFYFLRKHPVE